MSTLYTRVNLISLIHYALFFALNQQHNKGIVRHYPHLRSKQRDIATLIKYSHHVVSPTTHLTQVNFRTS